MNNDETNKVLSLEENQGNDASLIPQNNISGFFSFSEDDGRLLTIKILLVEKSELYVHVDETNRGVLIQNTIYKEDSRPPC